jgi:hypothetical protein
VSDGAVILERRSKEKGVPVARVRNRYSMFLLIMTTNPTLSSGGLTELGRGIRRADFDQLRDGSHQSADCPQSRTKADSSMLFRFLN